MAEYQYQRKKAQHEEADEHNVFEALQYGCEPYPAGQHDYHDSVAPCYSVLV